MDPLLIVGRRDGAFYKGHIVGSPQARACCFGKVGDLDGVGNGEKFVFAIEQTELTSVTGCELPYGQLGFFSAIPYNSLTESMSRRRS